MAATQKPTTWRWGADSELLGWQPKETASQLLHESRAICSINATPSSRPEAVGWAPSVCGRPADYLPPGTVGQWPPATGQWWIVPKCGDPRTVQAKKGDDSDPRPTSRSERGPTGTLLPAWVLHQGEGLPKPQHSSERDPRTLASRRHLLLQVVAATATTIRVGPFVTFVSLLVKRTVELTACPVCSERAR